MKLKPIPRLYLLGFKSNKNHTLFYPDKNSIKILPIHLELGNYYSDWNTPDIIAENGNILCDHGYIIGYVWQIFSEKFKEIVDRHITKNDIVCWLPINLNFDNQVFSYYALHLPVFYDVFCIERCSLNKYGEVDLYSDISYSASKIRKYSVIRPYIQSVGLYFREAIIKDIKSSDLIGVNIERINDVFDDINI
jgi:hypothetical protein